MRITAIAWGGGVQFGSEGSVGRLKRWTEDMQARFEEGTFARIASVLRTGEDRTDFVRSAVERELSRRAKLRQQAERSPAGRLPLDEQ